MSERDRPALGAARQDAGRLRFDISHYDFDGAEEVVERPKRRLWAFGTNTHGYASLDLEIHVELGVRTDAGHLYLILRAIPDGLALTEPSIEKAALHSQAQDHRFRSKNGLMFVRVRDPVQRIESVIPSSVWLKAIEKGPKFEWDGLVPLALIDGGEASGIRAEREITIPLTAANLDGGAIDRVVERMSHVVSGISEDGTYVERKDSAKSHLDNLLSGLRVDILENLPRATLIEGCQTSLKIGDVFFSASEE